MENATFLPTEIIFSATDSCNLKCNHCYVSRKNINLNIKDSIRFVKSCRQSSIQSIGFSGGEPFLYTDFLREVCTTAVKQDLLFDRIMTNGCWWHTEQELVEKLTYVRDSGFDGKIGLSFDSFHKSDVKKIATFCKVVFSLWNDNSMIELQSVTNPDISKATLKMISDLAKSLDCRLEKKSFFQKETKFFSIQNTELFIPVYLTQQSLPHTEKKAWQAMHWFKEDFCKGLGNILFVHPNGNIAPCCGFANESAPLIIGHISQPFEKVIEQAQNNAMVNRCFKQGLTQYRRKLKKQGLQFPGKTKDHCCFCGYICELENTM